MGDSFWGSMVSGLYRRVVVIGAAGYFWDVSSMFERICNRRQEI